MFRARTVSLLAVPLTMALTITACGGGSGGESAAGAGENGAVSIYGTEPKAPLLPANTTEAGGSKAVEALYSGLVAYRPEDAKPYNVMADSIKTDDAKVYNIKIKQGWKFHDGTEVKAKNFVDAWNYATYAPNAQQAASFFQQIKGYDEVHPAAKDAKPTAEKLSGVEIVGDYEFKVTLKAPFSVFTTQLGYQPFAPLPDVFFKDPKGFEAKPIGNGPMKFVSRTPNTEIKLTRFDDYQGENKVHFKDLNIKIYSSQETAYQDLISGNLDFMEALPPSAKVGEKYKQDLGEHVLNANLLTVSMISVPYYVPGYDNIELRRAISMAINREQITKQVLSGTYKPTGSFVSPGLDGYEADTCGEYCKFDAAKAKEHLTKSGFTGKLTIMSNADGGRKEPLEAICNSIKQTISLECEFVPATNFGAFRQQVDAHTLTGMSRSDWSADYPSIENFLNPRFRTGGSGNDPVYSNAEVDKLLEQADSTADAAAAIKLYQQAHRRIAQDLPSIPVWTETGIGGSSTNLTAAKLNCRRMAEYSEFRVKG